MVRRYKPGTLLYFGGAMHEVLDGGTTRERPDLTPGSPKSRWKPRWWRHVKKRSSKKWMQRAFATHKRGSLHRYLRVPLGQRIPVTRLRAAERRLARDHAAATGKRRAKLLSRLREVRLALTARRIARRRSA